MPQSTILCEITAPIAKITFNRPERLNGLGNEEWDLLIEALERVKDEPEARAVILTGAGRAFCAGGDVKTVESRLSEPPPARFDHIRKLGRIVRTMRELPKPILAQVNGPCFGAGFSLALACDLRICSKSATFGSAFSKIGFAADVAGTYLLPRIVGLGRALELHLLGEPVDAEKALSWGIVSRVVSDEDLPREAERLAQQLGAGPPLSFSFLKSQLQRGAELPLEAQIEYEAALQAIILTSKDAREGVMARNEKRPPKFQGK